MYTQVIRISEEMKTYLINKTEKKETFCETLERLLDLKKQEDKNDN